MANLQLGLPVRVQYMPSDVYSSAKPDTEDPFRHLAGANSHNHHALHPWGEDVVAGTKEFDELYAEANNKFMYHLWYTDKLAPYMATQVLKIEHLDQDILDRFCAVLQHILESGIDAAMRSNDAKTLVTAVQAILDSAVQGSSDAIFVRLGATSAKDSFAKGAPTTKPGPLPADADLILRRILTSGRAVGRLLTLRDRLWAKDPGEALIVQRWSPEIELNREIRVFCYKGKVTAASQDIWWEKVGWRNRYTDGFVQAIVQTWDNVKEHLPFDTCIMDVLMTPPSDTGSWQARVIEFNGFGAHLNTGSDLFHWVRDADILEGKTNEVTVRFVDDWEDDDSTQETLVSPRPHVRPAEDEDEEAPDWLLLEKQLQAKYADKDKDSKRIQIEAKTRLPLRGHWCSAY
ncbi:putative CDC123-like protein L884 [Paramyrothecium foliicola]|nr:putative CDC123-like protein L884 [Paramyrothecium foliicola]